ncbi:hypothetical protein THAOC_18711, partial [Thalassiosira oceanica]
AVVRRAAVCRPYGVAGDVPRALEQGRVDRQRVHGLGHLEAAAGVSPHGLEVAVERRDEELEVLRELAVPDAEVAELLGPVLRLGDARLVLHAGRYAVFLSSSMRRGDGGMRNAFVSGLKVVVRMWVCRGRAQHQPSSILNPRDDYLPPEGEGGEGTDRVTGSAPSRRVAVFSVPTVG